MQDARVICNIYIYKDRTDVNYVYYQYHLLPGKFVFYQRTKRTFI